MSNLAPAAPQTAGLSQMQRVTATFAAPSKLAGDILRSSNWIVPFLIMVVVSVSFAFAVQAKVGWERTSDNMIRQNPKAAEQMAQAPPERQAAIHQFSVNSTKVASYGGSIFGLIFTAVFTLLVWPTVNFLFGGTAKFGQIFAVFMYSGLISYSLRYLLAIIALFAGVAPESFLLQNPVGTNIGYYLPMDSPAWLLSLAGQADIFQIWALVVATIGIAIVARISKAQAATAVFAWWLIFILVPAGLAAARG